MYNTEYRYWKGSGAALRILLTAVLLLIMMLSAGCRTQENHEYVDSGSESRINPTKYEMQLELDDENDSLSETVRMTFINETEEDCSRIVIRNMMPDVLTNAESAYDSANTGCNVTSVKLDGSDSELDVSYKDNKTTMYVDLGEDGKVAPGGTGTVVVTMDTGIPEAPDRIGYQKTEQGKLYELSFCFPYIADNADGTWITDPFFDEGESRSYDLADYDVTFTAPERYKVAATGKNVTEGGETRITAENVRDMAIVACDFMEKETFEVSGITVNSWYLTGGDVDEYRTVTKLTAEDSIESYLENVGPYPYDELDITEALFGFGFGGMEFPGLIMDNASDYYSGDYSDPVSLGEVVAHEIGHQWFYSAVGNCEYREAWIDEGITTFLENDLYGMTPGKSHDHIKSVDPDYLMPEESRAELEEGLFPTDGSEPYYEYYDGMYLDVAPYEFNRDRMYADAEYDGAYTFIERVKYQMGEEKFSTFFKDLYERYYMKVVSSADIVRLIREYDDSDEMNEIIRFYFRDADKY